MNCSTRSNKSVVWCALRTPTAQANLACLVLAVVGLWTGSALAIPDPPTGHSYSENIGVTYTLDVGTNGDDTSSNPIYLDTSQSSGLSGQLSDGEGHTYRTLSDGGDLYFLADASDLVLSTNGVPYTHALIEISYQDTVHREEDTRPRLHTLLNFGALDWADIGHFAGENSVDNVWKSSTIFVERTHWQTLRADETDYFQFKIQNPSDDGAAYVPIDEIELSFVNDTTFYDARDDIRDVRGFIRADYISTNSLAPEVFAGQNFVAYSRNYLEKIYSNTVPTVEEIDNLSSNGLTMFEIAGQREPVTFAIYAGTNGVYDVTIEATDLLCGDASIPATNLQINTVAFLDKKWVCGNFSSLHFGNNPWYLDVYDQHGFDVDPETSKQVWITVQIPANTPKGVYQGTLSISVDEQLVQVIPLTANVSRIETAAPDATPHMWWSAFRSQESLGIPPYSDPRTVAADDQLVHNVEPIVRFKPSINTNSNSWPEDPEDVQINFSFPNIELQYRTQQGLLGRPVQIDIRDNVQGVWEITEPGRPYLYSDSFDGLPSPNFDRYYTEVLRKYKAYFEQHWLVTPTVTFVDEPNAKPASRREANHLNGLANQAGLQTWSTYSRYCERPVAGHLFTFFDDTSGLTRQVPSWVSNNTDGALMAYWDFADTNGLGQVPDLSGNENHGTFVTTYGDIHVEDGILVVDSNGYLEVDDDDTLDFTTQGTISLWFKPTEEVAENLKYLFRKIESRPSPEPWLHNYSLRFYGDNHDTWSYGGFTCYYATTEGVIEKVSGGHTVPNRGLGQWHNVLWVYDSTTGGTMYINGIPYSRYTNNILDENAGPLKMGYVEGYMDEVYMLNRALTEQEIADALVAINTNSFREQQASILLGGLNSADIPTNGLTLSMYDANNQTADIESLKSVSMNDTLLWSGYKLDDIYHRIHIDAATMLAAMDPGDDNTLSFTVTNSDARQESLRVYFHEEIWRDSTWTESLSANWDYSYDADSNGSSAPMDDNLDRRVYAMSHLTAEQMEKTASVGDELSYYTTGPATQPIILNNRFLNGVYASSVGATSVSTYSYGGWGSDSSPAEPYDDLQEYSIRMNSPGWSVYTLVQPSWEATVLPTLPYESLREGVEDSQIIATLKQAIADNPGTLADQAQQFLDDLFLRPSREFPSDYLYLDYDALDTQPEKYSDRSDDILEDLCVDSNGLLDSERCDHLRDFTFFDRMRATMVEYILKLTDTDEDGVADWFDNCQEHANAGQDDCDSDGFGDNCEIAYGFSPDCNSNAIPDDCEPDCNTNGVADECDITVGTSNDCNANGVPDECEAGGLTDCNTNGIPDLCDIFFETSTDCNSNAIPDECESLVYGILYVDDSATCGLNNGADWVHAYLELESALDHARCAGGTITEIQIGQGTYYPNTNGLAEPRTASFQLVDGVTVKGGYAGYGDPLPERRRPSQYPTILSGNIGVLDDDTDNCYHVFYHPGALGLNETAVLDGVTITGGNANGPTADYHHFGGAMYNNHSDPTLISCTFVENQATQWGGAICNHWYCYPNIVDCTFTENTAGGGSGDGGAIYNYISSPTLVRCLFSDNSSADMSGAMHSYKGTQLLTNCRFMGNSAAGTGGAFYAYVSETNLTNCVFSGNTSLNNGGAVANYKSDVNFVNCSFNDNLATGYGGTIENYESDLTFANCIIWNSTPTVMRNYGDYSVNVWHCCIEGGYAGTGNIDADPLFIDSNGLDDIAGTEDDDLRLSPGSPCIDAGSNGAVPADTQDIDGDDNITEQLPWDLDDNDRFLDDPATTDTGTGTPPIVDMGAYEFWPDCNTNGINDYADIGGISTDCNSNSIPDECEPDCNENGVTDECDIADGTSDDLNTNGLPDECESAPPVMTEALSQREHGTPAATYSIAAGNTECRPSGISRIKFTFDKIAYSTDGDDFVAGDFTLSRGTITNVATTWDDSVRPTTAEIILDIGGVTTVGQLTVSFSAENSVGLGQSYQACWTYVPADVDNDGDVDYDDETVIIAADQGGLATYFRCDLDLNGTIEGEDKEGEDWEIWSGNYPISPQTLCGD